MSNCFGNDRSATQFLGMAAFPTGMDVTVRDSYLRYGVREQTIERGYYTSSVSITTVSGADPIIDYSQNIAWVTRNASA